jgi:hypothetical protein
MHSFAVTGPTWECEMTDAATLLMQAQNFLGPSGRMPAVAL